MDFVVGLPRTKSQNDAVWVILNRDKIHTFLTNEDDGTLAKVARL